MYARLVSFVVLFAVGLIACDSDEVDLGGEIPTSPACTASIGGEPYNADRAGGTISSELGWATIGCTTGTGADPGDILISLYIDDFQGEGTYPFEGGNIAQYIPLGSGGAGSTAESLRDVSMLKITSFTDTRLVGTFEFVVPDPENPGESISISNGSFDVPWQAPE